MSDSEFPGFSSRWDVDADDVDELVRSAAPPAPDVVSVSSGEDSDDQVCVLLQPPRPPAPSAVQCVQDTQEQDEGLDAGAFVAPGDMCPICLSEFDVVAFLDRCFHAFCFQCVLMWAAMSCECPLCKTPFSSLIYDVESPRIFKTYAVDFAGLRGRTIAAPYMDRDAVAGRRTRQLIYEAGWRPSKRAVGVASRAAARAVDAVSLERLRPFVQRDLEVLLDDAGKDNLLLEFVIGAIRRVWPDAGELARAVAPFLAEKADVFVREVKLFLRLGHDVTQFDRAVTYEAPPR